MLKVLRIIRGSIPYGSMANELTVFSVDGCVIQQKRRQQDDIELKLFCQTAGLTELSAACF